MTLDEWKRIFARRLQISIDRSGMDKKEVATRANISPASITQYLNGDQVPSTYVAANLARVLKVDMTYLINLDEINK